MKASKSHELVTDVPASEQWNIYGTLRFVQLLHQLLPHVLQNVEVIRGDGGVGTVIQEAPTIKGDILNLGFIKYVTQLEIIAKGSSSSVIKSTVEYEFYDKCPELEAMAGHHNFGFNR
ncbi:hypothetical protein PR202_gb14509 [Eleusine coracana subsp. coracana]|uniref:Bet v I/Major latex protein domain-containing protein n=1 Tax=Eleusine coracana subsp. coracana TaxID=191504 RepID=A0AAV5EUX0_ELECO|nr:hypothetical protein PR202_gb14509 [Eleusine coracana subsp. coracana]